MNPSKSLNWKSVFAIALVVASLPAWAQKRRAVQHPGPAGPALNVVITGTVLDNVTGAPVINAEARLGNRTARTDSRGKFRLATTIHGTAELTVGRSGYTEVKEVITADRDITFRLTPTPTVRLRLTNGTTHDIDLESVEFGYVPPFGSYVKGPSDEFCRPGGATITLNRTDISKITGPAVSESNAACCPTSPIMRINATLKTGEVTPLYFVDSCTGHGVDFIGRDHVTGNFVYSKFTDVAEILFP